MRGQPGHNTRLHVRLPPSFRGMDAWMTSKLNVALVCKLRGSLVCLAYSFGMLAMCVFTTRQWQTAGRLVQEFNVCTVSEACLDNCSISRSSGYEAPKLEVAGSSPSAGSLLEGGAGRYINLWRCRGLSI